MTGPFNRQPYRPSWRKRDPVICHELAQDLWTLAVVIVLSVVGALLVRWALS